MNKEEIVKELDKQNKQLGIDLSLTKDKLNKTLFLLDKIKETINYYAIENEDYSKIYNQEEQEIMKLLEEIE